MSSEVIDKQGNGKDKQKIAQSNVETENLRKVCNKPQQEFFELYLITTLKVKKKLQVKKIFGILWNFLFLLYFWILNNT